MIFDSLGIGEIGVIIVVAILFVDPKKAGQAGRAFARFRKKWNDIQRDVKQQFDTVLEAADLNETPQSLPVIKTKLRREGRDAIRGITAMERADAAGKIWTRLRETPAYQEAKVVAAFCGTHAEVDTEAILRGILADGKTLLLPYIAANASITADVSIATNASGNKMGMAPVRNCDQDLLEGTLGILEPREELRTETAPNPDLILTPGLVFDECGGRIGRGRGYYDRYLPGQAGFRLGIGFEAQILRKKLTLEPHDQLLDGLITERRLLVFSRPRSQAEPTPPQPESKG